MSHEMPVVNTANIAANTKIGGPGTPGYQEVIPEGPITDKLRGGFTLPFMKSRESLGSVTSPEGAHYDQLVKLSSEDDGESEEAEVVRADDGKYAVAQVKDGVTVIIPLDEFGKSTVVDLKGSTVGVAYHPRNDELSLLPDTKGKPYEVIVTRNR